MTKYFAVALQQNRMIALKEAWIQNAVVGEYSKVYISPNEESVPNFSLKIKYLLDTSNENCYNARVIKEFNVKEAADKFICWKRPEYYPSGSKRFSFVESNLIASVELVGTKMMSIHSDSFANLTGFYIKRKSFSNDSVCIFLSIFITKSIER